MVPTIFALSSGPPPAAIVVVRVSGPQAGYTLRRLSRHKLPPPRRATLRNIIDPRDQVLIDRALVLWLPGPDTVTGEDLAEFHVHGGKAVTNALLGVLASMDGLIPAEPGGFTRRAFENGRVDLSQVEGLADLLAAETEGQRRNALAMSEGTLSADAARWRRSVLECAAQTEALLDFADEDDVPSSFSERPLDELIADIQRWFDAPSVERLRDGVRVVIAGPPNAGKSTLLNSLVGRSVAITAPIAGTTRDIVEASVAIDGVPFVLTDTAGLHTGTSDEIEIEGIRRARAALDTADIIFWLGDPQDCPDDQKALVVAARIDEAPVSMPIPHGSIAISARTGQGMTALKTELLARARRLLPIGDTIALNRRQRTQVGELVDELKSARASGDLLIRAEHLRHARNALDRLTGKAGVEDMLDALFGSMCIGK